MAPPNRETWNHGYIGSDTSTLKHSLLNRLVYTVGKDSFSASPRDWFFSTALATRDRLAERWMETMRTYHRQDVKRVYYLSLEFLMGRALTNSLMNLDIYDESREALDQVGIDLGEVIEQETDAALGNGGLGRLAACFLDSMATLRLPGYGYGIRYEYGMFTQTFENGRQVEHPENWLRYGNPWEFARDDILFPVKFYGRTVSYRDGQGVMRHHWVDTDQVMAMAYDTPIPGYWTNTVNNMRLWSAKSTRDFDLKFFNEGDYIKAVESKNESENISRVLYPNDAISSGRELRLRQEYFFVSATLQDILQRFMRKHGDLALLPEKVAIQLNDTHPALAIPELMRILLDEHFLEWETAWDLTRRTFAYTNHTLMPEALETWPIGMLGAMLPRHLELIFEINHRFLTAVMHRYPGDGERLRRMSLIDEEGDKRVRMAHLAIVGSHKVNGVAALHTELMQQTIFRDFAELWPERFVNITNGVTPRRWLRHANPGLADLISSKIRHGWTLQLDQLERLREHADDKPFLDAFRAIKLENKQRLAEYIDRTLHVRINPESLFDVQIKRIHEYKRQLLNILHVIAFYNRIREGRQGDMAPRTVIFAGKAAPGYERAKLIIKLINDVAETINYDPLVGDQLKVVFIPNYSVSLAERIIPAADLSEQISTAGTEASGTGNMKLALNGALTIGTLDGANIEIRDAVGEENIFIFGMDAEGVQNLQRSGYRPREHAEQNPELSQALQMLRNGFFSPAEPERYRGFIDGLLDHDQYMVLADFTDYVACQERVDALFRKPREWGHKALLNVAGMGRFSSDRTIAEYAEKIWQISPVEHE